jgi:hypothetical protein
MSGIEPVQEYNEYIKLRLLDAIRRGVVDGLPQPTMFGGKRMRNFVLPASTEYDYPSSLSVGHLGASQPDMLGGSFWEDFGRGFKQGVSGVAKIATPIVKEVATDVAKDALRSYVKGGRRKKKGGFLVGSDGIVRSSATGGYIGMSGNQYNESGFGSANTQLDNHPHFYSGAGVFDTFKSGFSSLGNAIAPIAKEVFHDVVVPEGKQYLKDQIKERRGKGGSKASAIIASMIGKQLKGFKIDKVSKPSGNVISYAKKAFGQTYTGKKPTDMWNDYKGEITEQAQEAPKKRGRKPKAPVAPVAPESESESDEEEPKEVPLTRKQIEENRKKIALQTRAMNRRLNASAKKLAVGKEPDIRGFFQPRTSGSGRGGALVGGDVLGDLGKVGQTVLPFLPLLMGLGRGDKMPPHPCGGNWADDLGKVSQAVAPFAPLLLGLGKGKMPSKYAINKVIKGGSWIDDLGKVSSAIAPFAPLLMGLGRGGSFIDDIGKVGKAILPFAPLLMAMGRGGSLSGKAVRRSPQTTPEGHESASFEPVHTKKGGVLITDDPSQFQTNTKMMPPALASYNPPVPSAKGGRKPSAPPSGKKRVSARGAIVSKIMKAKGLNLPQASKYVKENNLY